MRHKYADLIHAWCEGAEVEILGNDSRWEPCPMPLWTESKTYRIKPKESEWWENMPEYGVLVKHQASGLIYGATSRVNVVNPHLYIPLTNKEIERFKR